MRVTRSTAVVRREAEGAGQSVAVRLARALKILLRSYRLQWGMTQGVSWAEKGWGSRQTEGAKVAELADTKRDSAASATISPLDMTASGEAAG
jgi:hypothetical protein